MSRKKISFNDESILSQKKCKHGNVVFPKNALPFYSFLQHYDVEGSLGCGEGKFPQYKDGKYCCFDRRFTDQELLDYINLLLESAISNVGITAFEKNKDLIRLLIFHRKNLLERNPDLIDTFDIPEESGVDRNQYIEDWFINLYFEANNLSEYRPDPSSPPSRRRRIKSRSTNPPPPTPPTSSGWWSGWWNGWWNSSSRSSKSPPRRSPSKPGFRPPLLGGKTVRKRNHTSRKNRNRK